MQAQSIEALGISLGARAEARAQLEIAEARVRSAVLTLNAAEGMSHADIGKLMGVSQQAVSQMLKRASRADEREWLESQESAKWDRHCDRELAKAERGLERRSIPCFHCGRFKARPADECEFCGDTPLSHNGNEAELNRAYGYAA